MTPDPITRRPSVTLRAVKGVKRHPVTGRATSELSQRRIVVEPSPDWRHQ